MRRRTFLGSAAALAIGGVAGYTRSASDAGQQTLSENPVGQGLDEQPRLGPPREETSITLVTFDNPNCGSCASFHGDGFQTIRSNWLEAGEATLYARTSSVGGWAESAVHALEEARRRERDAYWSLKDRYFDAQDDMSTDNVVEKTRAFAAELEVPVDADAVAQAAADEPHTETIETDEQAAAAGSGGIGFPTPTTFLFEEERFVTTLGNAAFSAFETAVESDG